MKLEMHFFICFYEAGLSSREFLCFRTSPRRLEIFVCDSTLDLEAGETGRYCVLLYNGDITWESGIE